ncbi:type II toxin-antitoxin system RelE/ParE family toxin [Achromobacter sp. UMC71]|uniref:type II toxin-antitoxin system RelE/ParE family toxin n=1 Tax=Achromobacter sp. UMC71 TaxID=1862320 RepID=UPI0015FEFFF6|nr:type II toxin-antitoxin system RelE/ParE family toxin [Achromobacter sp. UMC71]
MTPVVFAPDALRDIIDMQRYFSAAGSARAADRYIDDVVRACLDLASFPYRGAQRDTVTPDMRFLHHQRRCTIAYKVGERASVTIIGIFYGGGDYSHLLREPPAHYQRPVYRTLAAIPAPGLGWSHGHTARRAQSGGTGRRLNLASDSGAHREESC